MNARGMKRLNLGAPNDPVSIIVATTFQVTDLFHERAIVANLAGTVTIQLPIAVGSGMFVSVLVGTNSAGNTVIVQRGVTGDRFQGSVFIGIDAAATGKVFKANTVTNANTLTLNGTTTGGVSVGDWVNFLDMATGIWAVAGTVIGSGAIATPFTNT